MGTRITAKGVDAEAFATEIGVPARTGISGVFLTNSNLDKVVWNYAPGSKAKGYTVGLEAADVTSKEISLQGLLDATPKYVETNVIETAPFTIFFIAKIDPTAPGWPSVPTDAQPPELRSMFVSDYGGSAYNYGNALYVSRGNAVACSLGVKADASSDYQSQTQHVVVDFNKYLLVSCKYDMASRTMRLKNHLSGLVVTSVTPAGFTRVAAGRGYRLGAASAGSYGGKMKMVCAQMHNVALSDGDIDKNAAFLKSYAERHGVTF